MRTPAIVVVSLLLCAACGPAPRPDAGVGGGGGSLFGGGMGGGGSSGGGAGGGGGGDIDAGTDAGQDAGPVDAGPTETFTFRVVQGPNAQPVANVAVRIAGQSAFVDGYSNGNGDVTVALAGLNQRPLSLTLTRLDHGVLSIVGLTTEFPTQVRLDPLFPQPPTSMISGSVTGRLDGGLVVVDSFDFITTSTATSTYQAQYVGSSAHALPLVAFELSGTNELVNWAVVDGGARAGTKVVNVAFPSTPEVPSSVPWSAVLPDAGILTAMPPVNPFVAGWHLVSAPTESWVATGAGSAARDATGLSGNFTGLTGPLAPNRLILELSDGASYLLRHRQRDLTPPISFRLPEVSQVAISGARLGNLAGAATAPATAFDTFCITAELQNSPVNSWRVCTAPGAPFSIPRLPDLPEGLTPADLSIASPGTMLGGLPLLIDFEDPAMRPWQLPNLTGPLDAYRTTFGGGYQVVTGAWR